MSHANPMSNLSTLPATEAGLVEGATMSLVTTDVVSPANPASFPQEAFAQFAPRPQGAEGEPSESDQHLSPLDAIAGLSAIQDRLQQLERRDWRVWSAALAVLLLMGTVLALSSAPFWTQFSIVLLFSGYAVAQQLVSRRIRHELSRQVDSMLLSQQIDSVFNLKFRTEDSHQLAMLDPVTGLYNRSFLEEHLSTELARSQREENSLTVVALHLKDFAQIIDSYGRSAGDLVLKHFGAQLKKAIRNSDFAARTGQDEFMVLFPEGRPEQVPVTLPRMADLEVDFRAEKIPVSFVSGWTAYQPGDSPGQLLDRAEQAVLADKPTGPAEPETLVALSATAPAEEEGVAEAPGMQAGPQPEPTADTEQAEQTVLAYKPPSEAEPEVLVGLNAVSSAAKDEVAGTPGMQADPQPEPAADAGQRVRRASARSAKPGRSATRRRRVVPATAPVGEFAALAAAALKPGPSDEPQSA